MEPIETEVRKVKKRINKKRLSIKEDIASVGKLGEETIATLPEDFKMMFAGKLNELLIRDRVRSSNILAAFLKSYGIVDPDVEKHLETQIDSFHKNFDKSKNQLKGFMETHPLWLRMKGIRGFSCSQLALVMAQIKDISKFDTASKLMVYAGIGCVDGLAITKANLGKIKEIYFAKGKEFLGFNTILAGRMFVISECLIKQKGYFYDFYTKMRVRLAEKAINDGRCEQREVKGVMEWYMKDKKNMSLKLWTQKNAMRRISRTILHFIWTEWRIIKGLEVRIPYPVQYLQHSTVITLDEVLKYDASIKEKNEFEQ